MAIEAAFAHTGEPDIANTLYDLLAAVNRRLQTLTLQIARGRAQPSTGQGRVRTSRIIDDIKGLSETVHLWLQRYSDMASLAMLMSNNDLLLQLVPPLPAGSQEAEKPIPLRLQELYLAAKAVTPTDGSIIVQLEQADEQQFKPLHNSAPLYLGPAPGKSLPIDIVLEYKPTTGGTDPYSSAIELARRLRNVDPDRMHLLRAIGVARQPDCAAIMFAYPSSQDPNSDTHVKTLRTALLRGVRHSREQRIKLVKEIATSIMYLHASRFVHKNIRPETILLFHSSSKTSPPLDDRGGYQVLGDAFLTGFLEIRRENDQSDRQGEEVPERNIYRHPQRQGLQLQTHYNILHDLYSFGVVLIELARWDYETRGSFINLHDDGSVTVIDRLAGKSPLRVQDTLQRMANVYIPRAMGQRIADIAMGCLQCVEAYESYLRKEQIVPGSGSDDMIAGIPVSKALNQDGQVVLDRFMYGILESLYSISL